MTCEVEGNRIKCSAPAKPNFIGEEQICLHCDGAGIVHNKLCGSCNGHGCVRVNEYGANKYAMNDEQQFAFNVLGGTA